MRPSPLVKNRLIRYPRSESILSGPLCLVPSRWYRSLNYRPLSKTESGIGSVVYELVKSRFKEAWRKFDQQKLKGKRFRPRLVSEGYFEEDELEKENLYEEVDFVIFHSQRESSDSGLSQTNSALSRNAIETSDEDPYYSSPARSKSFPSYGPEFSVGSSNISALMSCSERFSQCSRRGLGRRHLFNSTSTCDSSTYVSVPEYDSAPNLALAKKKFVVDEGIDFQRHVIHQISRALSICRSHPKLVDPSVHAEAEKIMLVAACKKQLLELLESMRDSTDSPAATSEMDLSVTLRNLKFVREGRWKSRKSKKRSWFFICVLETDNEVMASEMVKAEGKNIHFPNSFHFKGHSQGECIVKLQLYALALKNRKKKNKENSVLKVGPSSLSNAPEHTFFFLWGQADLKPSYKTKTTFQLLNIRPGASISSTFEADLETSLIIPIKKKGYLSVLENQTDQFIWKRKWCVLNGSILSYWNYKYEEGTVEPLKHVDLHFVRRLQVEPDREGTIVQPKCFALHFEGNDQFFACTDTIEELEKWRGKLNSVLEHIWRWKSRDEP
nr:anillin-like [Leptinotarsa decemlineata]